MYKRKSFAVLEAHLSKPQATVITGMRRVGKTTALHYLLEKVGQKIGWQNALAVK